MNFYISRESARRHLTRINTHTLKAYQIRSVLDPVESSRLLMQHCFRSIRPELAWAWLRSRFKVWKRTCTLSRTSQMPESWMLHDSRERLARPIGYKMSGIVCEIKHQVRVARSGQCQRRMANVELKTSTFAISGLIDRLLTWRSVGVGSAASSRSARSGIAAPRKALRSRSAAHGARVSSSCHLYRFHRLRCRRLDSRYLQREANSVRNWSGASSRGERLSAQTVFTAIIKSHTHTYREKENLSIKLVQKWFWYQ